MHGDFTTCMGTSLKYAETGLMKPAWRTARSPQGSLDEVVLRGGRYLLPGIQCRSANRAGLWYPIGINYAGFRVVVNLVQ